jgi:hypothetical protein
MLTTMTWQQVISSGGRPGNKVGLGYTPYEDHKVKPGRPGCVPTGSPIVGVRASRKMRLFGFYFEHVFYVLWFDRKHEISP